MTIYCSMSDCVNWKGKTIYTIFRKFYFYILCKHLIILIICTQILKGLKGVNFRFKNPKGTINTVNIEVKKIVEKLITIEWYKIHQNLSYQIHTFQRAVFKVLSKTPDFRNQIKILNIKGTLLVIQSKFIINKQLCYSYTTQMLHWSLFENPEYIGKGHIVIEYSVFKSKCKVVITTIFRFKIRGLSLD